MEVEELDGFERCPEEEWIDAIYENRAMLETEVDGDFVIQYFRKIKTKRRPTTRRSIKR